MNSFILVPYYNIIPKTQTTYFTIIDNTLIVTLNDVFGNSSQFLSNSLNQLIYIFNGPNMGTFTITSIKSSNIGAYVFNITLNSIPPNLSNGMKCVLSLSPSVYSIDRTFSNTVTYSIDGNFTLSDSNTILINKRSSSIDDTLFLYILITNKSFNIVNDISSVSYVIDSVTISTSQPNSSYIALNANIPIMSLIDGSSYEINISTTNASTISNTVINNTQILPINTPSINLSLNNYIHTPGYSPSITTHVNVPNVIVDHSKNINMTQKNQKNRLTFGSNAIINYQTSTFYGNGFFSLNSSINSNLVDLYTNVPNNNLNSNLLEHLDDNSYGSFITRTASNGYNRITTVIDSIINNIKSTAGDIVLNQVGVDNIPQISIFSNKYTLSISTIDSFKKPINFIKQHSVLFLSSGSNVYIFSTSTIPIHKINGSDTIIECNILLNKPLLNNVNNKSFVLSNSPVLRYVTFEYIQTHITSNVIDHGKFNILSISSKNRLPTIVISNYEILFDNDVSSFNSVLYTLIQNPSQTLSAPYLNILNTDFSPVCTLAILHAIPGENQTTFTYTVVSGASKLNQLRNKTNYIITFLSPQEFTSDNGILNTTKEKKSELTQINNIVYSVKLLIEKASLNKPDDLDIIIANNIILDTYSQSSLLINIPITNEILEVSGALLANTYNALQRLLKVYPTDKDALFLLQKIFLLETPIVILALLDNAVKNIQKSSSVHPYNDGIKDLLNYTNSVIDTFKTTNTSKNKIDLLNKLMDKIDITLQNNILDTSLMKAKNIINLALNPTAIPEKMTPDENKHGKLIETLANHTEETNDDYNYYIIFIILLIFFLMYIIHTYRKNNDLKHLTYKI